MMRRTLLALLLLAAALCCVAAQDNSDFPVSLSELSASLEAGQGGFFHSLVSHVKHAAADVGHDVEKGAKVVGHDVKKGAEKVGHAVKKDAKKVAHGVKHAAKKVGSGVKHASHNTWSKMKAAAKKVGHGVKRAAKDVGHGVKVAAKDSVHGVAVGLKDVGKGTVKAVKTEAHDAEHAYDVGKSDLHNAKSNFKAAFHNGFHGGKLLDAGLDVVEAPGDVVGDEMTSQANHAVAGLHDVGIHNKYVDEGVEIAAQVAGGFIAPVSTIASGIAHSTQNIQDRVHKEGWAKGLENSKMDIANLGLSALAVHGGAGLHSIADHVQVSRFARMSKPIDEEYVQFDRMDHDLEPLDENSDEFKAAVKEQQDYHKTSIKQAFEKSKQDKLAAKKAAPKDIRSRLTRTRLGGSKLGKRILNPAESRADKVAEEEHKIAEKLDDAHWKQAQEENKDKWYNKNPVAKKVLTPIHRKVFLSPDILESTERIDEFGDTTDTWVGGVVGAAAGLDNVVEDKEDGTLARLAAQKEDGNNIKHMREQNDEFVQQEQDEEYEKQYQALKQQKAQQAQPPTPHPAPTPRPVSAHAHAHAHKRLTPKKHAVKKHKHQSAQAQAQARRIEAHKKAAATARQQAVANAQREAQKRSAQAAAEAEEHRLEVERDEE